MRTKTEGFEVIPGLTTWANNFLKEATPKGEYSFYLGDHFFNVPLKEWTLPEFGEVVREQVQAEIDINHLGPALFIALRDKNGWIEEIRWSQSLIEVYQSI